MIMVLIINMVYIPRQTFTAWGTPSHYVPKNELEYLVMKYPNKSWHYYNLACNPNISLEFIEKNLWFRAKIRNHSNALSKNPNITIDFINKYYGYFYEKSAFVDTDWNWEWLSKNSNMTKAIIRQTMDIYPWDFVAMLDNPNMDTEFILENIERFSTLQSNSYDEITEKLTERKNAHNNLFYLHFQQKSDLASKRLGDFDYKTLDSNNDDCGFWYDLSICLFGYEDTVLYYEKRKQDSLEQMKQLKDELLHVTLAFDNLKSVIDEDDYTQLMERWHHWKK